MNAHRATTYTQRLVQGIVRRLLRHVIWHTNDSRNLSDRPGLRSALAIVLGREHYRERRKRYPALRKRDLNKVLREELAGEPPTLTLIGPIEGDGREVSFYRLDEAVLESLPRGLFVVPESLLLSAQLTVDSWADVERGGYRYYLFENGTSQPAGGALEGRELVALASGMDPARIPEEYRGGDEVLLRLRRSLSLLPVSTWWSCRNPLPRNLGLDRVAWKPLAVTAGALVFAYLALTSLYLQALLSQRENTLDVLEPQIQEGLVADNEARALEARKVALSELWSGRDDTQRLWEAVGIAVQSQTIVSSVDIRAGRVSLRGETPDASEVLAALASTPSFADVAFDAPVRSGRGGRQSFELSFNLVDKHVGAETGSE